MDTLEPPEWLVEPVALRICKEISNRLEEKGLLETIDPYMLGAYCHCMERA